MHIIKSLLVSRISVISIDPLVALRCSPQSAINFEAPYLGHLSTDFFRFASFNPAPYPLIKACPSQFHHSTPNMPSVDWVEGIVRKNSWVQVFVRCHWLLMINVALYCVTFHRCIRLNTVQGDPCNWISLDGRTVLGCKKLTKLYSLWQKLSTWMQTG